MSKKLLYIEENTSTTPHFCIIWLHGLGADGHDFSGIGEQLAIPQQYAIRYLFPHAPIRPVTINQGQSMRAWYDILHQDLSLQPDVKNIITSETQIVELINAQIIRGIAVNRIILAGFSQGGAIALHTGLRYSRCLAGIMALSAYLPVAEDLPDEVTECHKKIPIFMAHGRNDPIIAWQHSKDSAKILQQRGYQVRHHSYDMAHQLCAEEMGDIRHGLLAMMDHAK